MKPEIHLWTLKTKSSQQSKQWMHTHSSNKPKKFKQTLSACQKVGGNCFLGQDGKGMLIVKFMQQGATVTSEVYCKTLKKLHRAIQDKRHGMQTWCGAHPLQCTSAYSCSHLNTAGAFQLGVIWPPSSQPWSYSDRLPPICLPEELVVITALQQ
jgi:hypothetical protein